ncbi:MAG: hypothetical protein A2705_04115 [Omnitrophica WOR_2 bacterium RIFCSPHIGHO2_01_FULL_52_10]|nr:MAG: hypothetical protein A2705_04115 [Omnitrophica WOR_2 bacterium RIFCSPHIGHO2_01_FULL_52_10]
MSGYDETRNSKGQSTIEYILVVAAVIAALLIFAGRNGIFQNALNATYDTNINAMLNMAERILE